VAEIFGWLELGVYDQFEGVFEHVGDESGEKWTGQLKTGVGIDFNEEHLELIIKHEVKPKDFEGVHSPLGVQLVEGCSEDICGELLHLRQHISLEANPLVWNCFVNVVLQLDVRHFVAYLILAVIGASLLDGVIGQVDQPVGEIANVVIVGAGSDVAFVVNVGLGAAA